MPIPALISVISAAIMLILSAVFFVKNNENTRLSADIQRQTEEVQGQQIVLQTKAQKLQQYQQFVQQAGQLSQQIGPQVLQELAQRAVKSKNAKVFALLAKYGVTLKENTETPATPAAPVSTPSTPAPATR